MSRRLPDTVLFSGEKPFPVLPAVDHYAGAEKLMRKAMSLQSELGPIFDITCDCEDGARAGAEREHAEMCAALIMSAENAHGRVAARIHDVTHAHWQQDLDILVSGAGRRLPFITLPKPRSASDVATQIAELRRVERANDIDREIPVHVLIETHGALREVWDIAALPGVESLDFGLMDFVSGHHGAIPASAMRSPGQFEHKLIARAKTEVVAAALANGVIPAHNVTLDLKNPYTTYQDARRARMEFGFLRQWSIYPTQIQPIVDAMKPDYSEVETGAAILLAAQKADWGPIQHAGELHDRATYRYYWEVLQKARVTGLKMPAEAETAFFG